MSTKGASISRTTADDLKRLQLGTCKRRSRRKLHLGVDADTGRIVASAPTGREVDDGAQAGPLLDQVAGTLASFTGDGG